MPSTSGQNNSRLVPSKRKAAAIKALAACSAMMNESVNYYVPGRMSLVGRKYPTAQDALDDVKRRGDAAYADFFEQVSFLFDIKQFEGDIKEPTLSVRVGFSSLLKSQRFKNCADNHIPWRDWSPLLIKNRDIAALFSPDRIKAARLSRDTRMLGVYYRAYELLTLLQNIADGDEHPVSTDISHLLPAEHLSDISCDNGDEGENTAEDLPVEDMPLENVLPDSPDGTPRAANDSAPLQMDDKPDDAQSDNGHSTPEEATPERDGGEPDIVIVERSIIGKWLRITPKSLKKYEEQGFFGKFTPWPAPIMANGSACYYDVEMITEALTHLPYHCFRNIDKNTVLQRLKDREQCQTLEEYRRKQNKRKPKSNPKPEDDDSVLVILGKNKLVDDRKFYER